MPNFEAERRIEANQIRVRLAEIEETIYADRQSIGGLEACVTGPGKGPERAPESGWKPFKALDRWGGFDQTTWFRMTVEIPASMKGHRVVAFVRPGGESLAFVNGKPAQGLDRNRDEVYLTEKARGGETFEIAIESVPSTRFDEYHTFDYADIAVMHPRVWDFYWDCTTVVEVWQELDAEFAPRRQLMELLAASVKMVDLQHKNGPAYFASIEKAQRHLRQGLKSFETSYGMGRLTMNGHSHIDTAWLWPVRETRRKCGRTFSTVLSLMERYPEFRFSCSQAAQYEIVKEYFPELYRDIQKRVKEGRWEPTGGMYVEPDLNVPSGESLVRQVLYGKRFFRKEFGVDCRVGWTPDTFGYCWALPQILRKAGFDAFVTMKLRWGNQFTEFPYNFFQWEGCDGTRLITLMPDDYNNDIRPERLIKQWQIFKQKDKVEETLFCYGFGDGGGGPTMKMLEHGKRVKNIVGVPKSEFGTVQECLDRMRAQCDVDTLPVWNGELYFELHRGCQTSQARTKKNNRKCELLLRRTEFLGVLAQLKGGKYDHKTLFDCWRGVLLNQFHDILPGTSLNEVYKTCDAQYAALQETVRGVLDKAVAFLAGRTDTSGDGMPLLVINTQSWVRTGVAEAEVDLPYGDFTVVDPAGDAVPAQRIGRDRVLFEVRNLPPMGYAVYRIVPGTSPADAGVLKTTERGMENACLRIRFDKNGALTSIYDKVEGREVLPKGERANVLQMFDDRPAAWDAWDIDFNFEEHMWEPGPAESIEVVETGPLRAVVRIVRKTEHSTITQDVTLHAGSPRIDFVTRADWWEKKVLLKAAFPVDVRSSRATYEVQYAAIERPTHHNRDADRAMFEVPAHRWADLSEGGYGVSLLNDCKYGYDIKDNVMRLSLLRAPTQPDPRADEGEHSFTYALYPHAWDWRNGAVQQGAELNDPILAVPVAAGAGPLPAVYAFASVDADHVVLDTVKRHEDSSAVIVRLYEAYGQRGDVTVTFAEKPVAVTECDLMEENDQPVKVKGNTITFFITPHEIRTFKVEF